MKRDPSDEVQTVTTKWPPSRGPGSGKDARMALAVRLQDKNEGLALLINEQAALIQEQAAEVALLKRQVAERKPKGGRQPMPDGTVDSIEAALATGASVRSVAKRHGVSAMSVSRVRKRVKDRAALSA